VGKFKVTKTEGDKGELAEAVAFQVVEVKKMLVPALLGSLLGFVFYRYLGTGEGIPWFSPLFLALAAAYYLQRAIFPLLGLDVKEFERKDWLYVEFVVLLFLILSWTFLLN